MNAQVIDLDSRRQFRVVMGRCRCCGVASVAVQDRARPLDGAPCHECGAHAFDVTHVRRGANFMPRLDVLQ